MLRMNGKMIGADRVTRMLNQAAKNVKPVAAKIVNDVARAVQSAETAEINRVIDKPNRFTQTAIGVKWATPSTLTATVFVKPIQAKYLAVQMTGGTRAMKISEQRFAAAVGRLPALVPSRDIKKDQYGNLSKATQVRLLAEAEGKKATTVKKRRSKTSGAFAIKNKAGQVIGIFKRTATGIEPLMLATRSAPQYRKRFDFLAVAAKATAPDKVQAIVARRIERELFRA